MDSNSLKNCKVTADLLLNKIQRELLVAFKAQLEKSFNVELFVPNTENSFDVDVFATVYGQQQDIKSIKKFVSSIENELPSIISCDSGNNFSPETEINTLEGNGDNCLSEFKEPSFKKCISPKKNHSVTKNTVIVKKKNRWKNWMKRKKKISKNRLAAGNKDQTSAGVPNAKKKRKLNSNLKCQNSGVAKNISKSSCTVPCTEVCTTSQENIQSYQNKFPSSFQGDCQRNVIEVITLDDDLEIERPLATCYLRPIVIDGSNIAREHGKTSGTFSCKGIEICVQYFLKRGHKQVTAFVPHFRRHYCDNPPTTDAFILEKLAEKQHVVFTPSRTIGKRLITSYDDRFIVELACINGGVILSNDNFKDLAKESELFRRTIETRLLMFCFVGDIFMIPSDPMGRSGLPLEEFLSFPPGSTSSVS